MRAEIARLKTLQEQDRGRARRQPRAWRALPLADPARHDARRPAHPDRRRAEPADVRQRLAPVVQPYMRELLRAIGGVLAEVPNRLTLEGHTDATPFSGGERGYSNWELSADRANASRRELLAGGLPDDRVLRVQGLASSQLFDARQARRPDQPPHQHHRDEARGRRRDLPAASRRRRPTPEPSIKPETADAGLKSTGAGADRSTDSVDRRPPRRTSP